MSWDHGKEEGEAEEEKKRGYKREVDQSPRSRDLIQSNEEKKEERKRKGKKGFQGKIVLRTSRQ